ncbi:hypothetical protein, partial [Sinimarinibacterium flocculans]|uniref:hypothetical protein n=1 Tax=Sinimarinibacterium flocculans TaxID=985250 RepID=UPI002491371F
NITFRGNLIEEDLAGSSYNLDPANPHGIIIVDQDSTDINVGSFSKHGTPYQHLDVLIVVQVDTGTFTYARVHPYTANGAGSALTAHTRINTKGTAASSGIWNLGTDGPDGAYYSLAANSVYRLTSSRLKDSTAPGHQGTLNIFKVADIT